MDGIVMFLEGGQCQLDVLVSGDAFLAHQPELRSMMRREAIIVVYLHSNGPDLYAQAQNVVRARFSCHVRTLHVVVALMVHSRPVMNGIF